MKTTILIEGHAGQGPNALSKIIGSILAKMGYYAFVSREYGSFIRGGHNANTLTFSEKQVMSNPSCIDIAVFLEKKTEIKHSKELKKSCIILENKGNNNMYSAGALVKLFGIDFKLLESELGNLANLKENLAAAKQGFDDEKTKIPLKTLKNKIEFIDGSKAIALGAIKSGLDTYFAYPMTPSTGVLAELAEMQYENNFIALELESEIAVINSAIGSAITGAKSMIGTSGGGFDLMTESVSLLGQAEIPLVIYLAQRLGPSTGGATYTAQADMNIALNPGHGEFPKLVVAAGDPLECEELTSQAFYFSQKYKIPSIILSDKHLAESLYSMQNKPLITKSEKSLKLQKFNSYEHGKDGIVTDDPAEITKNAEARIKKSEDIAKEAEKFKTHKIFGKQASKNIVLFWGSTKGAVLDAIEGLDAKAIQVLYLDPFPKQLKSELKNAKKIIIVENNSTAQLASLASAKTNMEIDDKNKILRFDGRPFLSDELKVEIERRLK